MTLHCWLNETEIRSSNQLKKETFLRNLPDYIYVNTASLIKDMLKFCKESKKDKNTYAKKMGSYTVIVWFDLICLVHLLDQQRNVD